MQPKVYLNQTPSILGELSLLSKQHQAIDFTIGVTDFHTPQWLTDRLQHYIAKGVSHYAPVAGVPKLKEAIAEKTYLCYGVQIADPMTEMTITVGAFEAIYALVTAYIDKGDEVIYFDPAFEAYPNVVALNQGTSVRLALKADGRIDLDAIQQAITPKTKMIILNSPHNPMGTVISKAEYQRLAEILEGTDIIVLSDEVYEHIYAGERFDSAIEVEALRPRLAITQSLGKTYNITGWRLGVCIAPKAMIRAVNAVKQFATFSAPNPMQTALGDTMSEHPEYWQNLPKQYQHHHQMLMQHLQHSRFKILPWHGTPYQIIDYRPISDEDDFSFCSKVIKEHGVGVIPISTLYGKQQHGLLRLCFAKYDEIVVEGAKRLSQV